MALTKDQVRHIARLARIKLTDSEIEDYAAKLSSVLDYIDILNELKVGDIEPTYQVTGIKGVWRSDEVKSYENPAELLGNTELALERGQIKVKKVFD